MIRLNSAAKEKTGLQGASNPNKISLRKWRWPSVKAIGTRLRDELHQVQTSVQRRRSYLQSLPVVQKTWHLTRAKFATASLTVAVLILIGCVGLVFISRQQQAETTSLTSQISVAESLLDRYGSAAARAARLAEAETLLQGFEEDIPASRTTAEVFSEIIALTSSVPVAIQNLEGHPAQDPKSISSTYQVLNITFQAKGSMSELQTFIWALETGAVKAISVERVTIGSTEDPATANITISAYGRQESE
jgi:hypothetical protein